MTTLINPKREKGEPTLPETGLLVLNPADVLNIAGVLKKTGARKHFFFNGNLLVVPGEENAGAPFFMAGPAVGSPMAVLAFEKLIALGAGRIIVFGWCGSLISEISVGDVLLPTWAVSDEGTSKHYPVEERPESSSVLRGHLSTHLGRQGIQPRSGPIWTTDAPYRETRDQVETYGGQGVLGVDMEFSALCTVASFRRVEMAAVMLVSDELCHPEWKPGFRTKVFREKSPRLIEILLESCRGAQGAGD